MTTNRFPDIPIVSEETLPPEPDWSDPRTPAIVCYELVTQGRETGMFFCQFNTPGSFKRYFTTGANGLDVSTDARGNARAMIVLMAEPDQVYEGMRWVHASWKHVVPTSVLRDAFSLRFANRLNELRYSRVLGQAEDAGFFKFKGLYSCDPSAYKNKKNQGVYVAESVRDFLRANADTLTWATTAKEFAELIDNTTSDTRLRTALVRAWNNHPDGRYTVELADCGHADLAEDVITATRPRNTTFCGHCANEDLRQPVDDEYNWYHTDHLYCHFDGGWYTYEEEEEDDDDTREDDDSDLESWGRNTTHALEHDRSFVSSHKSDFIMGCELEVECNDWSAFSAAKSSTLDYFNKHLQYVMLKRDGSLSERGFEIVTAARRLPEHIKMFGAWEPPGSLTSWNAGNCGLHVHVDSGAFTALSLGRFLQLYNDANNAAFIRGIAGRHPLKDSGARSYAAALDQDISTSPVKALKGGHTSRYRMVNLTNLTSTEAGRLHVENHLRDSKGSYSTVEVRIFRGTLRKSRLLAQIEFVHATVVFCRTASNTQLNEAGFLAWLRGYAGAYPYLARWFKLITVRPRPETARSAAPAPVVELAIEV